MPEPLTHEQLATMGEAALTRYLQACGCQVLQRYSDKERQARCGDLQLRDSTGQTLNVDIKVERHVSSSFPVETVQCLDQKRTGWLWELTDCDFICYAQVNDRPDDWGRLVFRFIYKIDVDKLRSEVVGESHGWRQLTTSKGWGRTQFFLAPLRDLMDKQIAVHCWGDSPPLGVTTDEEEDSSNRHPIDGDSSPGQPDPIPAGDVDQLSLVTW